MAKKNLGEATAATSVGSSDSVLVEIGGSIRRIKVTALRDAIMEGGEATLSQVAWGANIKETSATNWGTCGNKALWNDYKAKSGRFLVTADGRAARIASNGAYFIDGTAVDETKGNVMVIAPALHYLWDNGADRGYPVLWMSMNPIGGHSWGNADNGRYICYGAYPAGLDGSSILKSGTGYVPKYSYSIKAFWAAAQKIGTSWGLIDYPYHQFKLATVLSEYGNSNGQAAVGAGVAGTGSSVWEAGAQTLTTGATKALGTPFGKIPVALEGGTDCSRISVFWFEDPWGLRWESTQGCYFGSSENSGQTGSETFIYDGNRLPTDAELKGKPSGTYRQLTKMTTGSSSYITKIIGGEYFDIFASVVSGSSTTYWADCYYTSSVGQLCLLGGGMANVGSACGPVAADLSAAFGHAGTAVGSRLAYYGPLTFVDGREIK